MLFLVNEETDYPKCRYDEHDISGKLISYYCLQNICTDIMKKEPENADLFIVFNDYETQYVHSKKIKHKLIWVLWVHPKR